MNFFTRVWAVITSHVNAWADKLENPERVLDQSIRDMQKQVNHLRGDVVKIVAEEKKLKNQLNKHWKEVERWDKNSVLAVKEGNDVLARAALGRKREALEYAQQLQPQWEQQQRVADTLKQNFRDLRERIETAQRKKRMLTTRLKRAETQKRLQGMLNDLSDNQVFDKFETKLLDTEAMNAAQEELQGESLGQQFKALSSSDSGNEPDVDRELEALKERMRLNP
ncbi:MAG: PspA/IM30 family protein [bacterium]|nr:PspA/IM30 family protein [bacterium]